MKLLFQNFGRVPSGRALGGTRCLAAIAHASIAGCFFSTQAFAQQQPDSTAVPLEDVMVTAVRATQKTPVTFSNVQKEELERRNLGQDIPILLNFMPSVVTTSDAGNGFGYTGIRVRGSDATRVNVTINGIPYNDSESSGTFWVNMPDFASSLQSIQLQRGVGTSTNGAGAFGASLNLLTDRVADTAYAEISNSFGSFNSRKHTVKFGSGRLNNSFELSGRLSLLKSDGYIDRATSDLKSYFLQGTYMGKTSTIKGLVFGGKERTYQAWNGLDAETLALDPTFNYSGMYTDEAGNTRFYKNEVDDYSQDHFQLHWNERWNERWSSNLALHYTIGRGFYENYKEDADLAEYGMAPVIIGTETITESDLVRRKWLDNDFYGTTFSAIYRQPGIELIFGGALNNYEGLHFGEVVWSRYASTSEPLDHYYDQYARKTDLSTYAKAQIDVTGRISVFGDIQFRNVSYKTTVDGGKKVDESFSFLNPKAGLNFTVNRENQLYLSYAKASKEPNRTDYENGSPKHEELHDFELGWRFNRDRYRINTNLFYMLYRDQLVKTGEIDEIGAEIRRNVDRSYRAGVEVDAAFAITSRFTLSPNLALSVNKIEDYAIVGEEGLLNLGDTNISFSPNVIGALVAAYRFNDRFYAALLSKYVGEQYAGNIDTRETRLDSYSVTDLNVVYEIKPKAVFQSIVLTAMVNNLFDARYVSNAYLYGENYISYFPQAGTNFLAGATLRF